MSNRKSDIFRVSRQLFNDKGYSNVTIRMIAMELKISSGNLNYHFQKREDILEGLYFEMVAEFDERIKQLNKKKISLQTIKDDIQSSMERMVEYRFFWTDLYNLLRLNDRIKSHFEEAYQNRFNGYRLLFNILIENQILRSFEFKKEDQFLTERMIDFGNTWLYNSSLYEKEIHKEYIELQSNNLLSMLFPYLTDLGKKEFKELVPDYFV